MKTIRTIVISCCILTIVGGLCLTLASTGWRQLDGIAIVLTGGVLLPYFLRD